MENEYKKIDEVFKEEQLDHITIFAARYALGRRTFAPEIVSEFIRKYVELLSSESVSGLIEDITERERWGTLGDSCDVVTWNNLRKFLFDILEKRNYIYSKNVCLDKRDFNEIIYSAFLKELHTQRITTYNFYNLIKNHVREIQPNIIDRMIEELAKTVFEPEYTGTFKKAWIELLEFLKSYKKGEVV